MIMHLDNRTSARRGFALVTVLFSLVIITILFASASTLTLNHLQDNAALGRMAIRDAKLRGFLDIAMVHYSDGEQDHGQPFHAEFDGEEWSVSLQDVSGLVDLNTASPALLDRLFEGLGLEGATRRDALTRLRDWRKQGNRLSRVSDAVRIMQLDMFDFADLDDFATVYSGEAGIAFEAAPPKLRDLLSDGSGQIAEQFRSAQRGVNFVAKITTETGSSKGAAVLHLPRDAEDTRVLSLN